MQTRRPSTIVNVVLFFLVSALIVYIFIRAATLDMTHDEAYSFYNVKHFWWVETLCTGNTHWFNFLAIKAAVILGLEKTMYLRWFSLLTSCALLTITFLWIKRFERFSIKLLALSLTLFNPFLIDYLSLARGYSAGLLFETLSITCYCISVSRYQKSLAILSLFFAGMSAIANFNFFYFFVAFALLYFYTQYKPYRLSSLKQKFFYVELLFAAGVSALVIKALRFIETCSNDIGGYGGTDLAESVFSSFINTLLYGNFTIGPTVLVVSGYTLFVTIIIFCIYGILASKKHRCVWYTTASILLPIMLGLTVVNKWCLGVLYPTDRTSLIFYPLIVMVFTGFLNSLIRRFRFTAIFTYGASLLLVFNFLLSINLNRTFDYYQQADTYKAFTYLDALNARQVGIHPELYGVYRNYYQMTDHYNFHFKGESIQVYYPKGIDTTRQKLKQFDYIILFPPYNLSFYKNNPVRFKGVSYFKNTQTIILKVDSL